MTALLRALASVLVLLLAVACADSAHPLADGEARSLRIAAWNIEHLSAAGEEGCRVRDEAGYDIVARYVGEIDADVWLLQEIESEAALVRVFGETGWRFHVDERPAREEEGPPCREAPERRLGMQRTAIAVREGIAHERLPDLMALEVSGRGHYRPGVAVRLSGEAELDLMSVHLASGCHEGESRRSCPALFAQLPALEAWIDARSLEGRAAIIGGDFNRRLEIAGDAFWEDLADGEPAPLRIAGEGVTPSCDPRYTQFIDFFVLNGAAFARKAPGSFREVTFAEAGALRPSDHCPIVIELTARIP